MEDKDNNKKTSTVFTLKSDNQFIRAKEGAQEIGVNVYMDDLTDFDLIHHEKQTKWSASTHVGPTAAKYKELRVFGVTIGGDRLMELIGDLTVPGDKGQLLVNRVGLCILYTGGDTIKRLRINDRFGWSKYGVEPPISGGTRWSVWDMNNGAVLVDAGDDRDWEKVVQEKEKEMEEKEKEMRKRLEEKEKEVASLKAALNALTIS